MGASSNHAPVDIPVLMIQLSDGEKLIERIAHSRGGGGDGVCLESSSLAIMFHLQEDGDDANEVDYWKSVGSLFDRYADNFEKHLREKLDYKTPELLASAIDLSAGAGREFRRAVDLGCGTGLCAEKIRHRVDWLTGMDLSQEMVAHARKKSGLYDEVIVGNFEELGGEFDLIVACDVFLYAAELHTVFGVVSRESPRGSLFVFSVENPEEGFADSVQRSASGRFAHSDAYVLALAAEFSFETLLSQSGVFARREGQSVVLSTIFVLERK